MASSPIYNPVIPFVGFVPGGALQVGQLIKIIGIVDPNPRCFAINLQLGPKVNPRDDIALHLSPVFSSPSRVVRNNLQNQCWGAEESHGGFPFSVGQQFEILILVDSSEYRIAINGRHFTEFKHRMPYGHVSNLTMDGDFKVSQILYDTQTSISSSAPPNIKFPYSTEHHSSNLPYPVTPSGKVPIPSYQQPGIPNPVYPAQAYVPQAYPSQAYPSQAYPSQAYPSQAYPSQAYPSQAYPSQAYPSQAYPSQGYPQQHGSTGAYIPQTGGYGKPYKKKGIFGGIPGGMATGLAGAAAGVALGSSLMPKFKMKKMFKHKFKGPKFLKHKGFFKHKGFGFGKSKGWGKFKHKGWGYDSD